VGDGGELRQQRQMVMSLIRWRWWLSIVSYYEFEIATLVFGLLTLKPTSSTDLSKYFNLFFKFHFSSSSS